MAEGGIKRKSRLAVFEHVVEKEKEPKKVRFRTNRLHYDDSSPSESELVIKDEDRKSRKKKKAVLKLSEEPLNLRCEWEFCEEFYDSWEKFNSHLMKHASVLKPEMAMKCQWTDCSYLATSTPLLMRHLSYHGYLAKLKNIGQNITESNNLPRCKQKESIIIPVDEFGYTCLWEHCSFNFCTIYEFFLHMRVHVKNNPSVAKEAKNELIYCCWSGCNTKYSTQTKLAEHLRTHTKEKIIGCPTCCTLFSNKTKFCDHRRRQLSSSMQSYQCSQCLKLFPSERLLRDHMRSHINTYKCTMCDMTCPKPSVLAKHMRYKHIKEKPYKCTNCDKKFVTKCNLVAHSRIHEETNPMKCDLCDFSCRTQYGLDNHHVKKHDGHGLTYECHCCKSKFKRGGYLTKHLTKIHNYHWPSGHSRFRYRKDQDGIFRLQTVRYESLEVTEEMIRSESMPTNKIKENVEYHLSYNNCAGAYSLSVSTEGDTEPHRQCDAQNESDKDDTMFITIEEVDAKGNILKSEIVKSEIVIELPPLGEGVIVGENTDDDDEDRGQSTSFCEKSTDDVEERQLEDVKKVKKRRQATRRSTRRRRR